MPDPTAPGPAGQDVPDDIRSMGFEDALSELEGIVRALEAGEGKLDQAITAYERGVHLKRHCEAKLAEAKTRVERISFVSGGGATAEAADFA